MNMEPPSVAIIGNPEALTDLQPNQVAVLIADQDSIAPFIAVASGTEIDFPKCWTHQILFSEVMLVMDCKVTGPRKLSTATANGNPTLTAKWHPRSTIFSKKPTTFQTYLILPSQESFNIHWLARLQ